MGCQYAWSRSGAMTMPPSQMGAFTKSDPSQATREPRVPRAADLARQVRRAAAQVQRVHRERLQPAADLARPRADQVGRSARLPGDRAELPRPRTRTGASPPTRSGSRAASCSETEALKKYEPEEYTPGASYQSEDELVEAAGKIGTTIFHPVGTCKMGRDSDAIGGGGYAISRARHRALAHNRRFDHADDHVGKHEFADADDRRAGRGNTSKRVRRKMSMQGFSRKAVYAVLGACSALATLPAFAQAYPAKPIEVTVHTSAGSGGDIVSRAVAEIVRKRQAAAAAAHGRRTASAAAGRSATSYFKTQARRSVPDALGHRHDPRHGVPPGHRISGSITTRRSR